jgi:hypothetical protein
MRHFKIATQAFFLIALTAVTLLSAQSSYAGGSFALEDILPILQQDARLATWISNSLDIDETGDATRIGQTVNPRLGGMRIGPYVILAKPKGAGGAFTFELTVETEIIGRSAAGKIVDIAKASTITEKLQSVSIRPYKEGN